MRFRDLGPFSVEEDGVPVPLAGRRLWAVLALLAVNARSAVPADRIVSAVWGPDPPARPEAALDSLLWRLRRVLEPGRRPRSASGVLHTTPSGYVLAVSDDNIDSRRFLAEADGAASCLRTGDPAAALVGCDTALHRWRGAPFDGVPEADWLGPQRERLRQARIDVSETRLQALLALRRPEQAAADAGALLTDHPYRERIWAQHMLGLYRAGRQADALAAYEKARHLLAEDLGIDPGQELTTLHAAMLAQDPTLVPAPLPATTVSAGRARRRLSAVPLFGRDDDLDALQALLARARLVTVTGPMGVGKTALAVTAASGVEGSVLVDLTAVTDAAGLVGAVTSACGIGVAGVDPEAVLVAHLERTGMLLVLDNCEQILPQAAQLVAGITAAAPDVRVLVTSREPLGVAGELVHRLMPLPVGVHGPATELFLAQLGGAVDRSDWAGPITEICAAVGGLPLGIELAARRARAFSLTEIADSVRRDPGGLTRDPRSSRPDRTLAAAIEDSHRLLSAPEQRAHRRLSVLAGPFTLAAAAAVVAEGHSAAMDVVAALAHRSLLLVEPAAHGATRFRQLVPLRADAGERLDAAGDREITEQRRAAWLTSLVGAGPRRGRPGQREWYEQLTDDWSTVTVTVDAELGRPGDTGALLVVGLQAICYDRNRTPQGLGWLARAAALQTTGNFARAAVDTTYGAVLILTRQAKLGKPYLDRGVAALLAAPDDRAAEAAGILVDAAAACWVGDQYRDAEQLAGRARQFAQHTDARHEADLAETIALAASFFTTDPRAAGGRAIELIDSGRLDGNGQAQLFACATAGIAAIGTADTDAGLHWTAESLRISQQIGALNLGGLLEQRAGHLVRAGRLDDAVRSLAASAAHADDLGEPWPAHPGTTDIITTLRTMVTPERYTAAQTAGRRIISAHSIDIADWV